MTIGCQGCGPFISATNHLCDACYQEKLKQSACNLAYHLVKWADKHKNEGHNKISITDLINEIDNLSPEKYKPPTEEKLNKVIRGISRYVKKCFHIYIWNIFQWINKRILKTYTSIEDCARCYDCGRNIHDFDVPDELWKKVVGKEIALCYDCFANKADKKLKIKWRTRFVEKWDSH